VLEVIRRREGKPSKLLGRNYLIIIFDDVKNKLLADEIVVGMWLDKIGGASNVLYWSCSCYHPWYRAERVDQGISGRL
jgi:hypothetical protein